MPLSGRKILVTGASGGIGRALTRAYAQAGARVFATGRDQEALAQAAAGMAPGAVTTVAADLTGAAGRKRLATAIDRTGGELDVAVHAAGLLGPPMVPLADYPEDAWREVFEVNVTAVQLLHQEVVGFMASPDAVVIGVSSTVGRAPRAGWGMYSVSKYALEGWLALLAQEFPGKVFSVNPGGTRTPMRAAAAPAEDPMTIPAPEKITPIFLRLAHGGAPEASGTRFDARDWIDTDPWSGLMDRPGDDA